MDWKLELLFAARILLSAFLGAVIGWDRERQRSNTGVRTCMTDRRLCVQSGVVACVCRRSDEDCRAGGNKHWFSLRRRDSPIPRPYRRADDCGNLVDNGFHRHVHISHPDHWTGVWHASAATIAGVAKLYP